MPLISCVDCSAPVVGARQRQRCDPCRRRHNDRKSVRTLRPGEQVPPGAPSRYVRPRGYVLLRWRIGVRQYVEVYEHRVIAGRVTEADHVHHLNGNRSDNRPENLLQVSTEEHAAEHWRVGHGRRDLPVLEVPGMRLAVARPPAEWWPEAARMYAAGASTYAIGIALDRDASTVYRALVKQGVSLRSEKRIAVPRRELARG